MQTDWTLDDRFDFEGQHMACRVMGEGPPVVLVHGTPFSSHVWRNIARELARDYKVHLFDLLGYGQSEKSEGAGRIARRAEPRAQRLAAPLGADAAEGHRA